MSRTFHSRKPRKRRICSQCGRHRSACERMCQTQFGRIVHSKISIRHWHRSRELRNNMESTQDDTSFTVTVHATFEPASGMAF